MYDKSTVANFYLSGFVQKNVGEVAPGQQFSKYPIQEKKCAPSMYSK
jgi:hypothetical protein